MKTRWWWLLCCLWPASAWGVLVPLMGGAEAGGTFTPTGTVTATRTRTRTETPEPTFTVTPTVTPTGTATATPTPTPIPYDCCAIPGECAAPIAGVCPGNWFAYRGAACSGTSCTAWTPTPSATPTITPLWSAPTGRVLLQGRPHSPDVTWQIPVTVEFRYALNLVSIPVMLDASGGFTFFAPTGSRDIAVKGSRTLRVKKTVAIGVVTAVAFGQLLEGDANDDNAVDALDTAILNASYGKCAGGSGYDARADFNGDECVNANDRSLLTRNLGLVGATAP